MNLEIEVTPTNYLAYTVEVWVGESGRQPDITVKGSGDPVMVITEALKLIDEEHWR